MQDRLYFRYVFQKKLESERTLTSLKFYNIEDIEHPNFMDEINELSRKGYVLITRNFSTGLKDKNGKLIFEGDIVKHTNEFIKENPLIVQFCDVFLTYLLFEPNDNSKKYGFYPERIDYKVIGNIYENPELLKEVQE